MESAPVYFYGNMNAKVNVLYIFIKNRVELNDILLIRKSGFTFSAKFIRNRHTVREIIL